MPEIAGVGILKNPGDIIFIAYFNKPEGGPHESITERQGCRIPLAEKGSVGHPPGLPLSPDHAGPVAGHRERRAWSSDRGGSNVSPPSVPLDIPLHSGARQIEPTINYYVIAARM